MPTAGRLAGALAYFIFGWYIATAATPFFTESRPPATWIPVCVIVGFLCGWIVCGSRVGRGYWASVSVGLTTTFAFVFWVLFSLSLYQMIRNALRRLYDTPVEAVLGIFEVMAQMAFRFADATLIISVVVGGLVAALFAEYFAKRYP